MKLYLPIMMRYVDDSCPVCENEYYEDIVLELLGFDDCCIIGVLVEDCCIVVELV